MIHESVKRKGKQRTAWRYTLDLKNKYGNLNLNKNKHVLNRSIRRHAVTVRVKQTDNTIVAYFNVQFTSVSKCQFFIIPLLNGKWNCNFFAVLFTCFVPSARAGVSGRELRKHVLNFLTPVPAHLLIDQVVQSPHLLWGNEINQQQKT